MPSIRQRALELRRERTDLINQAREILDGAEERDDGLLTQEEQNSYDALMNRVAEMLNTIERLEGQARMERDLQNPLEMPAPHEPGGPGDGEQQRFEFVSRGLRNAYETTPEFLAMEEWRRLVNLSDEARARSYLRWLRTGNVTGEEMRALQVDSDTVGGFLVTPMQMVDRLIQAVDNAVYVRQWATVFSVPNADSLGAPSLDTDPADPTWTSELAIGSEDSSMAFGRRELHPHPLAKYIKISNTLLRKVPSVEELVRSRLSYKFAVTMENAYLNGSGSGRPLGVFVASDDGISTSRDVSTGNETTSIKFDGLIEAKYTLKQQYWPRARWIFHRDGVKQIAKLKDGNGQYIWRESVRVGEPDRVLGIPAFMSEYAPNTFTSGEYVGLLGDWSYYWIADSLMMSFQRLVELYAATNQTALIGRMESDGMPVLEEAFVRVELA